MIVIDKNNKNLVIPNGLGNINRDYQEGYEAGSQESFEIGKAEGLAEGKTIGIAEGKQIQKDLLETITITENGTYNKEDGYNQVIVDVPDLNGSYDEGYQDGYQNGEVEQKSKLTNITISENGTYSREDGYNEIIVDVPDLNGSYEEGYNQGYAEGEENGIANAGETIAQTARVLNITENGTYTSEYSQWDDYPKPELVTGIFEDGKEFFNYTQYDGYYDTGIIPTKDTKLEFWIKDNSPTNYGNILYIGVDGLGASDFYFGKVYTRQQYIASIGSSILFFNQTDEWLHIIMSIADGLIVNGEKIGDFELSDFIVYSPIYIGQQGGGGVSPTIGMVKINDQIIIPTTDGLFNITTNEYLSIIVPIRNYIYTNNFTEPIAEGNLIRTVNVNIIPKIDVEENGIRLGYSIFTEVPDVYDFEGVINMNNMFRECSNLQTIPLLNTSNVTNMSYMFYYCGSLQTIPLIDTSNVTNMNSMFSNCGSLQTIPLIDTSNVTDMNEIFRGCSNLQTIPPIDTSNVTTMNRMFFNYGGINSLISLPKFNVPKVTDISAYFYYSQVTMNNLTEVGGWENLKCNWNDNSGLVCLPNLTYQSCINILNGLYDFVGHSETPQSNQGQLKVHQNFLNLVGDEISIATNKGWTITA